MRKLASIAAGLAILGSVGCTSLPGGTDLYPIAKELDMKNITTGDGTFADYTAVGHYKATEVGIGVGIPFVMKFLEFPPYSNEALLKDVASAAKADQSNALINVTPHKEIFTGFPFFFIGLYIDRADGTGIVAR